MHEVQCPSVCPFKLIINNRKGDRKSSLLASPSNGHKIDLFVLRLLCIGQTNERTNLGGPVECSARPPVRPLVQSLQDDDCVRKKLVFSS